MVARKEAATHTYTPELNRGQGSVSQKHTLIRPSTAAAVRAGAGRVVAAAVCIAFEVLCAGGLEFSAGFS